MIQSTYPLVATESERMNEDAQSCVEGGGCLVYRSALMLRISSLIRIRLLPHFPNDSESLSNTANGSQPQKEKTSTQENSLTYAVIIFL